MYKLFLNKALIPALFVVILWIVFGFQYFGFITECYGIIPHDINSLRGILFSPLLHADINHIFNNSIVIFVLLFLSFLFYQKITYLVLVIGWIFNGLFVWTFPYTILFNENQQGCHIGASGLIYVFLFFLFFSGIIRKYLPLMALSLLVVFLYGSLIWGIFPEKLFMINSTKQTISWESHLSGAFIGIILSYIFRKFGPQKNIYLNQNNNIDLEAEILWEEYKEKFPEDFDDLPNEDKKNVK